VQRADELSNAGNLVKCLLEVDKSEEVVGDALVGCFRGFAGAGVNSEDEDVVERRNVRLYGMIKMLLKANPKAVTSPDVDGNNLLHHACLKSLSSKVCIDIMQLVLTLHKDAVKEVSYVGRLPVHNAATACHLEVVEFLLGLYPEAANVVTADGRNLLHLALGNYVEKKTVTKMQYLCSRYPAMTQQRDKHGRVPVHMAHYSWRFRAALTLYEATGMGQFRMPMADPTDVLFRHNGHLPLHLFVSSLSWGFHAGSNLVSEDADMFRWWLRVYPEAAGIVGGVGAPYKKTPYQLAVAQRLPDYYLRLLLRAAPTLNPAELHRLNYAERRMAMFLAFKATSGTLKAPLLVRLRGESKDLVQRVVSFL
jgi:hypothetical protein